jgi:2'-5' RNA ligase
MTSEDVGLRCFVGVPIGEALRDELAAAVEAVREGIPTDYDALRWTDPTGWHLTLAFLGSVLPDAVEAMVASLERVAANHAPFVVPTAGLGAFPSRRDVRVLWYGLVDRSRRLAELAVATREAAGVDRSAPFRAHLTLARSIGERGVALPSALWKAPMPSGEVHVDRLVLYRSHLSGGPAHYESMAEAKLGGALGGRSPGPPAESLAVVPPESASEPGAGAN